MRRKTFHVGKNIKKFVEPNKVNTHWLMWYDWFWERESLYIDRSGSSHTRIKTRKACWWRRNPTWNVKGILNGEGVRWLTRVSQEAWKLAKTPKDWQTGVIISIYKKDDRRVYKVVQASRKYRFLAFQERCMPSVLKGNVEKQCNQSWKMASVVFVLVSAPRTKFLLWGKFFEKSWEYAFACFVDLEKPY